MDVPNLSRNVIPLKAVTTAKIRVISRSPTQYQNANSVFIRCSSINKLLPDIIQSHNSIAPNKMHYIPPNTKKLSDLQSQYMLENSCKKKQPKLQVCDLIEYYTPQSTAHTKTTKQVVQPSTCDEAISSLLEYATVHSNLISNPDISKAILLQIGEIKKCISLESNPIESHIG